MQTVAFFMHQAQSSGICGATLIFTFAQSLKFSPSWPSKNKWCWEQKSIGNEVEKMSSQKKINFPSPYWPSVTVYADLYSDKCYYLLPLYYSFGHHFGYANKKTKRGKEIRLGIFFCIILNTRIKQNKSNIAQELGILSRFTRDTKYYFAMIFLQKNLFGQKN